MKVVGIVKPKKAIYKKKNLGKKNIVAIVKDILAKNVENKKTATFEVAAPVCTIDALGVNHWMLHKNWDADVWTLPQGTAQAHRIGNIVKMKRWVIKGQIQPYLSTIQFNDTDFLWQSYQGYLTIYFGRRRDNGAIEDTLTNFFDSGDTSATPKGSMTEMMSPINTDLYKVYWSKTFKMGTAYGANNTYSQNPNNDFSLTRTFGFDVCKYIMKNRVLRFQDGDIRSSDRDLSRLAIWALWRPAVGSLANPSVINQTKSFYLINLFSYGEYEDA